MSVSLEETRASTKTCSAGWVTRACRTRASSRKLTRAKNYRPAGPKSQWTRPFRLLFNIDRPFSLSAEEFEFEWRFYI